MAMLLIFFQPHMSALPLSPPSSSPLPLACFPGADGSGGLGAATTSTGESYSSISNAVTINGVDQTDILAPGGCGSNSYSFSFTPTLGQSINAAPIGGATSVTYALMNYDWRSTFPDQWIQVSTATYSFPAFTGSSYTLPTFSGTISGFGEYSVWVTLTTPSGTFNYIYCLGDFTPNSTTASLTALTTINGIPIGPVVICYPDTIELGAPYLAAGSSVPAIPPTASWAINVYNANSSYVPGTLIPALSLSWSTYGGGGYDAPVGLFNLNPSGYTYADGYYVAVITGTDDCGNPIGPIYADYQIASTLSVTVNPIGPIRCYGEATGTAKADIAGSGVTYLWSTVPPQTTQTATGLAAGTYTVTVTNGGCSATGSATITQPNPINIADSEGQITCHGDTTGQISLTVTGGTPYGFSSYYFVWSPNVTATNASGSEALDLGAGTYSVTAYDENSCSATATFVLNQPPALVISGTVHNVPCGDTIGGYIMTTISGGVPGSGYTYLWSPGGAIGPNLLGPLAAGTYSLTVSNAGCADTARFNVLQDSCCTPPLASLVFPDSICVGSTDTIKVSGGTWGRIIIDGDPTLFLNVDSLTAYGGLPLAPIPPAMVGAIHTICYVAYTADPAVTSNYCSDTVCMNFTVINCCTRPTAVLTLNGSSSSVDTFCLGSTVIVNGSGAQWGKLYGDGGQYHPYVPIPTGGLADTSVLTGHHGLGTHSFCFIATNDTTSGCADTVCFTVVVINCCTPPAATFTINGSSTVDTVCLGSTITSYSNGAAWGKVIDHSGANPPFSPIPAAGVRDTTVASGSNALGTHTLCFIGSSDSLGTCTDTICVTVVVIDCGCGTLYGTSNLISNSLDNMQYQFYDSFTSIAPNFINWIVDDSVVGRTVGTDTFTYQFSPGQHIICMQTGTFLPGPNGNSICCYNTICDSINIDACAFWKATDSISYQLDSTNVDSVTFTFHGSTSPLWPTLVWNFGDGTTLVSSDLTIGHLFPQNGLGLKGSIQNVCVDVIWSRGDSITYDSLSVCCCVDTICFTVSTTPCALPIFYIAAVDSESGSYVYQVLHSTGYTDITNTNWAMINSGGTTTGLAVANAADYAANNANGPFFTVTPPVSGEYTICANFSYTVLYNGVLVPCSGYVCQNFNLLAQGPTGGLSIYPNPNNGQAVLQLINYSDAKSAQIELSDMTGQTVLTKTINGLGSGITQNYMDISNLPQGIYTVKMTMGSLQQVSKLIKE